MGVNVESRRFFDFELQYLEEKKKKKKKEERGITIPFEPRKMTIEERNE